MQDAPQGGDSAFAFEGTWREFAPIAFTNLLLTIVTLGIYRFWATARERRYLWSRSRFVDENLEWSGTGMELFVGFLLVALLFLLPFFVITQVAQSLMLRGQEGLGLLLTSVSFLAIFYLTGVARFRALRYRLARTRWRGIRGGSDDQGFGYGLSYMWKTFIGYLAAGLLIPWSMTSLWNERWGKMSFGPHRFEAHAEAGPIFLRFFLFYLAPFVLFAGGIAAVALGAGLGYGFGGENGAGVGGVLGILGLVLFYVFGLGLIAVAFYAAYYREAVGKLDLERSRLFVRSAHDGLGETVHRRCPACCPDARHRADLSVLSALEVHDNTPRSARRNPARRADPVDHRHIEARRRSARRFRYRGDLTR